MHRLTNEVTKENATNRSESIDEQSTNGDECSLAKRKTRPVRSVIKSSVQKLILEKTAQHNHDATSIKRTITTSVNDKRPFPFGQCRVCTDKATGAHYGVPTCEGCKGFFKRSILRKEKYRCYFGDKCVINTDNRNRCKSCRFLKCLHEGMSVDGVRMGRIPKLVKEKALAEHHLFPSSVETDDFSSSPASVSPSCLSSIDAVAFNFNGFDLELIDEQLFLDEVDQLPVTLPSCTSYALPDNFTIDETKHDSKENQLEVNRSVLANCEEQFGNHALTRVKNLITKISHSTLDVELKSDELLFTQYLRWKMLTLSNTFNGRTRQLAERMNSLIHLKIKDFPGDLSCLQDIWAGLTDAIPLHVKNLITFAREMPAINEIDLDDFQKIMNNRLFDFWLIKHAPLIRNNESYIILPNGLQYTRQWMNEIIGEEIVEKIFEFAQKINQLNLTLDEYALAYPIVICNKDKTLNDQETVHQIQYCYLYTLYTQMLTTRPLLEAKSLFRNVLQILTVLPLLNELQEKKFDSPHTYNMEADS